MSNEVQKTSSVVTKEVQTYPQTEQSAFPTWIIITFLVIVFVGLKGFLYTKDPKRHGK